VTVLFHSALEQNIRFHILNIRKHRTPIQYTGIKNGILH